VRSWVQGGCRVLPHLLGEAVDQTSTEEEETSLGRGVGLLNLGHLNLKLQHKKLPNDNAFEMSSLVMKSGNDAM